MIDLEVREQIMLLEMIELMGTDVITKYIIKGKIRIKH
jgi:hypothetical protein